MITHEHVRDLLRSPDQQPVLVLLEGREQVVPAAELDGDRYRGALEIISRDDLTALLPARISADALTVCPLPPPGPPPPPPPPEHELSEVADRLQTVAAERGGGPGRGT
ncbi:hypothetical protein [Streptomyces xinghaiensis]|uniref:hypothetical protein n=1 Tax=Streptomyces xinghaiensis TaxID=1038928 RepID=UPI003C2B8A51